MPIQLSGSLVITGSITTTGVITMSGSIASASYSSTSDLLQGTGSVGFTTTASFNAVSSSQQQISASYIALSASYNTFSGSASTRITANSSSIQQVSSSQQQISASLLNVIAIGATTGSNSFRANQSITGSLTVTGQIIAQTLNVQQVTSSIIYSSGSNIFGCDLNSRQTFTGSVLITGSLTIAGASSATSYSGTTIFGSTIACSPIGCFATSCATAFIGGTMSGTTIYGSTAVCSPVGKFTTCLDLGGALSGTSASFSGNSFLATSSGDVGIGTVSPNLTAANRKVLDINGTTESILVFSSGGTYKSYIFNDGTNLITQGTTLKFQTSFTDRLIIASTGAATFCFIGSGYGITSKASSNYNGILTDTSTNTGGGYFAAAKNGTRYSIFGTTGAWVGDTSTDTAIVSEAASSNIRFYTNGSATESMRITCAGYVGIGTCTPAYSLSVKSGWIHNYGAQNASGFRYENDAYGHVLNLNANNSYAQLYTSTDTSLYFGTSNDIRLKILNTGETCFKCNAYFCGSTYGIMGFGEKVMDKICYITTTTGTLCVALDGLTYSSSFPTRAIYLYGTLLDNDAAHYAHMIYFYRNDYGGLQTCTISQSSLVHPSTAGQPFTFSVNDPGSTGKGACTLLLRFTSAGAGVSPGNYCTKMRIVVYNVPGL